MSDWKIECALPIKEHAEQVMNWRNDPVTLRMSYDQRKKTLDPFVNEFYDEYFTHPTLPPIFILRDGKRVAFIRFREVLHPIDPSIICADISINVDPDVRGKGIGKKSLELVEKLIKARGVSSLLAEIKPENSSSIALFKKGGYKKIGEVEETCNDQSFTLEQYLLTIGPLMERKPVFIIAEAGSNWKRESEQESWNALCQMIETAAAAGADGVKFQLFSSDELYVENAGESDYLVEGGIKRDISDLIHELELPEEWIPKIADECRYRGIEFLASVFSEKAFAVVDPYVKKHKIASYENNYPKLLELAARSQKPVLLSTGASTNEEVDWAVDTLKSNGCKELVLMQCTAAYPAAIDELNLRVLLNYRTAYGTYVGLSDHSRDPFVAPVAAVALGANVIEKHFTLSRGLSGPDHYFSLEPRELNEMVAKIRATEEMLGDGIKKIEEGERELYDFAKRGIQAIKEIRQGEKLVMGENVAILRPGKKSKGIYPKFYTELDGKVAKNNIHIGEGIQFNDY